MPFCNKCGKKVSEDDEFCPSCGKKLAIKEATTSVPTCPKCKNKLTENDKFCARCGTTVKREITRTESRKNPLIAAVLNFFIPGAGYLYAGKRVASGIGLVAVLVILSLVYIQSPATSKIAGPTGYLLFPSPLMRLVFSASMDLGITWTTTILFGFVFAYDVFKQTKRENSE